MAGARQLVDGPRCDWRFEAGDGRKGDQTSTDPKISQLAQSIEFGIIPRLMLAHRGDQLLRAPSGPAVSRDDVQEFVRIVVEHDVAIASAYVEMLRGRGVAVEVILLEVMAPAARLLGDLWMEDLCSFAEVTVSLSSMQQILRSLKTATEPAHFGEAGRALLATIAGEQHSFGLFVAEDFLRRSGWSVRTAISASRAALLTRVGQERFDLIGLSASCDHLLDQFGSTIQALRRASLNRHVTIVVGGRIFVESPELVVRVGADAMATDGRQLISMLRSIPKNRVRHS